MREAVEADLPRLIEMGRQFHAKSSDAAIPFDGDGLANMLGNLMASGCVFISDDGFICGAIMPLPWLTPTFLVAHEILWWAEKTGPQLFARFEEWAREKGASRIVISHREGRTAAFERLYRKRGYESYEHYYQRAI